ncbi:putative quinol monooxygenase [Streptomyces griseoruber]|uniref:putative quinol monooxygenase n=1 Tax=Streptomyces griseoruber TaxID=1943 RepID=UPI000A896C66|nr:hypothetical protein [Streptomyces griseoruber]
MAIVISATWTAHPGQEGVVRDALAKLVPATRAEPWLGNPLEDRPGATTAR